MRGATKLRSLVALVIVVGCGAGTALEPSDASVTPVGPSTDRRSLPCDVDAILAKHCRGCHGDAPAYGAPMPLVSYGDLVAPSPNDPRSTVLDRILARVHDDARPMPPAPAARLDETTIAALARWADAGALPSSDRCSGGGSAKDPKPLPCTPDQKLLPAQPFRMPRDAEDLYVCYGVDIEVTDGKRHVIAIAPEIDNAKIVHHALLFQADAPAPKTPFSCGGGKQGWRMVYGWAPGVSGFELPKEAGLPEEIGTSHWVVQIHYNNLRRLEGETDGSGFGLCTTTDLRPNDAEVLAFGTHLFEIPARGRLDTTCSMAFVKDFPTIHAFAALPHMHQLGTSISTTMIPASGAPPIDLGSVPYWNFADQQWFRYEPVEIRPGDRIETRCVWTNPGASSVRFGEGTLDEMCYSFTMFWPKITLPGWRWVVPAISSQCQVN
jgi:hypothetical protein